MQDGIRCTKVGTNGKPYERFAGSLKLSAQEVNMQSLQVFQFAPENGFMEPKDYAFWS